MFVLVYFLQVNDCMKIHLQIKSFSISTSEESIMKTNLCTILLPIFFIACDNKEDDTSVDPEDTSVVPEDTAQPDESNIPDCSTDAIEHGMYGFVGQLDLHENGTIYVPNQRNVVVFPVLSESDIYTDEDTWFGFKVNEDIEPLYTTQSDSDGCFSIELPVGEYSIVSQHGTDIFDCESTEGICQFYIDGSIENNYVWDNTVMY